MALHEPETEEDEEEEVLQVQVSHLEDSQAVDDSKIHASHNFSLVHECLPL